MSTRARAAALLASSGVLGLGWGVSTANGTLVLTSPAAAASPTTTTASDGGTGTWAPTASTPTASETDTQASTTTAGTTDAALADGTYIGETVTHHYGSVTVTVTISGGRISALSEQIVEDGDRKSSMINSRSIPVIRDEIVAANSAQVSTVSGATYTTGAYLSSLQSALDKA